MSSVQSVAFYAPAVTSFAGYETSRNGQSNPLENSIVQKTEATRFFSPVMRLDNETQNVVLQYRNPFSGEVERQIPAETVAKAYSSSEKASQPV